MTEKGGRADAVKAKQKAEAQGTSIRNQFPRLQA